MITAILGVAVQVTGLLINIFGAGIATTVSQDAEEQMMQNAVGRCRNRFRGHRVASCESHSVRALQMKKLENWGLAMDGSILAMVPCLSPCCFVELPVGIWCLVVLTKDHVKMAFK